MRRLLILICLLVAGCGSGNLGPAQIIATEYQTNRAATVTPRPTQTPVPSATIGFEQTAIVAQSTADEARRVNAMVTAEFEQRVLAQLQVTAEHERMVFEVYSWTVTAALTSIPLTATQQAAINTQVPVLQTIDAAKLTATNAAPAQVVAMERARNYAAYGKIDYFVRWGMWLAIGVFVLSIAAWVLRNPVLPKPSPVQSAEPATVVMVKRDHGQGGFGLQRMVVPCTPDQLTEFAECITQGSKTLAINQWEGKDTLWTRPVIHEMRGWLQLNKFAVSTGDGQLATTDDGLSFLYGWLDTQQLPTEYAFDEETQPTANGDVGMASGQGVTDRYSGNILGDLQR